MNSMCFVLNQLDVESHPFALNEICKTLCSTDMGILKRVEFNRLNIDFETGDETSPDDTSVEDCLSRSIIFNQKLLPDLSSRYAVEKLQYNKLVSKLIDYEVENMPRSLFLGSSSKSSPALQKSSSNYQDSPQFCNSLIYETFAGQKFDSFDSIILFFRTRFLPIIPAVNNLHWYVRPHFPGILFNSVERLISGIEDSTFKNKLLDYKFLMESFRISPTPQAFANTLLVISSIMKVLYESQLISETSLNSNWISFLCNDFIRDEKLKTLILNDEVLSSVAISCNILSSCSNVIDSSLSKLMKTLILSDHKGRDGPSVYYALEAFSRIEPNVLESILRDKNTSSSRRKLISTLSLIRIGYEDLSFVILNEKLDQISKHTGVLASKFKFSFSIDKGTLEDIPDFKGILALSLSLLSPQELKEKSKDRSFNSGNIPSSLKYDSILAYMFGSGLNIGSFEFEDLEELAKIEAATKDIKCLSLIHFVKRKCGSELGLKDDISLSRFDPKQSWLQNICAQPGEQKYSILKDCKILPRIDWGNVPLSAFDFILKHTLSITPITQNVYINPSLLKNFSEYVFSFIENDSLTDISLTMILNIIKNTPDERSFSVASKLFIKLIENNDADLLATAFENLNPSSLKFFDFIEFNRLKPKLATKFSKIILELAQTCSFNTELLYVIDVDKVSDTFSFIKSVIEKDDFEHRLDYVIEFLNHAERKNSKIETLLNMMDLMFVKQSNLIEFPRLTLLIDKYCENPFDHIPFDSHTVERFRLRMNLIPENVKSRLNLFFDFHENDKKPF